MALALNAKHFVDESIEFEDNTGTPLTLTLVHCTGDTNYSGGNALGGGNRALAAYGTRGGSNAPNGNTSLRAAAHEPASLTLTLHAYEYTEATVGTARDWVYQLATFAAALSFEDDTEVFSFKVTRTMAAVGTDPASTLTYTRCVVNSFDTPTGEPNTMIINMTVYGTEVAG